jgi:hypothetical protein
MVLEGKIARLIEVQICYGMEMNVEKTGNENLKATITITDYAR